MSPRQTGIGGDKVRRQLAELFKSSIKEDNENNSEGSMGSMGSLCGLYGRLALTVVNVLITPSL